MKQGVRFLFVVLVASYHHHHHPAQALQSGAAPTLRPQPQRHAPGRRDRRSSSRNSPRFAPPFFTSSSRMPLVVLKDAAAHFPGSSAEEESSERKNASDGPEPSSAASSSSSYYAAREGAGSRPRSSGKNLSVLRSVDEFGLGLKPKAVHANAKATLAETQRGRFLYTAQSCLLYTLFILYRAYRGFFIIAPAVFRATRDKLETVVEKAPFDDDDYMMVEPNPKSYSPWRTRVTVSVLAALLTVSYLVGGALRVAVHWIRSTWSSRGRDVPRSFQAAANEQERNEAQLLRLTTTTTTTPNATKPRTAINGEQQEGLAP